MNSYMLHLFLFLHSVGVLRKHYNHTNPSISTFIRHFSGKLDRITISSTDQALEQMELITRPSALGMSDPIWGPLIHIFVDEKKKCEG